ncbi:hypothetical protein QR680_000341 [Steinernema hermaphroditum]|uniref:BZIP domain-containing protein n=1 Tax=Steinernema hermaphroditum TaxID=289476 RepID=A0AA39LDF4_9BILA|nr:hypothetical protein QR680_000341 [Steinernema hermaphroditum]
MYSPRYSESDDSSMSLCQPTRRPRGRPKKNEDPTKIMTKREQDLFSKREYARKYREDHKNMVKLLHDKMAEMEKENAILKAENAKLTEESAMKDKMIARLKMQRNSYFPEDLRNVDPFRPLSDEVGPEAILAHCPPPSYTSNNPSLEWQNAQTNVAPMAAPNSTVFQQDRLAEWLRQQENMASQQPTSPQMRSQNPNPQAVPPASSWQGTLPSSPLWNMLNNHPPATPPMDPHQNSQMEWSRSSPNPCATTSWQTSSYGTANNAYFVNAAAHSPD